MRNLKAGGEIDLRDFLARADVMAACGTTVLISDYFEYYRLAAYLSRYTKESIAITMGAGSLQDLFDEKYYKQLEGGVLESFGRLFKNDLKIYCYPLENPETGELMTCDNLVKCETKATASLSGSDVINAFNAKGPSKDLPSANAPVASTAGPSL